MTIDSRDCKSANKGAESTCNSPGYNTNDRDLENESSDDMRFDVFNRGYGENQAFLNKLREKFYNEVFLNKKDMLIDKDNLLVLFEFKLIMHKLFWSKKQQIFKKIPTGVMKKTSKYSQSDLEDSAINWSESDNEFALDDYPSKQAFRNKIQQMFYESVVLNSQDMLIDKDVIILFEHKLVMRKFAWNPRAQDFEKIPTGVSKEYKKLLERENPSMKEEMVEGK